MSASPESAQGMLNNCSKGETAIYYPKKKDSINDSPKKKKKKADSSLNGEVRDFCPRPISIEGARHEKFKARFLLLFIPKC